MSVVVNNFERLKVEYESCPDFYKIFVELKDETTREVDKFILHDGYLFISHKLCILRISLREFLIWKLYVSGLAGHFGNEKTIELSSIDSIGLV